MKTLGDILKKERKKQGLTQTEFAKIMGTTQISISHYETGKTEPTLFMAICLAKALNVSLDYLTGME